MSSTCSPVNQGYITFSKGDEDNKQRTLAVAAIFLRVEIGDEPREGAFPLLPAPAAVEERARLCQRRQSARPAEASSRYGA